MTLIGSNYNFKENVCVIHLLTGQDEACWPHFLFYDGTERGKTQHKIVWIC